MSGPDGPEQRTAYAEDAARDRDDSEDARLEYDADLQRDDDLADRTWMRHGDVDSMNWPKPITVMPVNTDGLEEQARKMIKRMAERL